MKNIVVTGASGLIGKSIVKNLINRNVDYYVTAVDLKPTEEFSNYKSNHFSFIKGDCNNQELVDKIISNCQSVIHLAAPSSFLMYKEKPQESTINTIHSFINLMESMKKYKVKKIVYASTSAVYEGNPVPYKEDMVINPPDLKALSKKFNEETAAIYCKSDGIISIAMRPFSVYGEAELDKGGYANIISLFSWAMVAGIRPVVWGNGTQTRDFIHADDVAEIFCLALEQDIATQPFNVGTGIETTFNEIINIINDELNTKLIPEYIDVPIDIYAHRLLSDNSKIETILKFKPKISLLEGIKRIIKQAKKVAKKNHLTDKQLYFKTLPHNEALT